MTWPDSSVLGESGFDGKVPLLFSIENNVCHWRDRFRRLHFLAFASRLLDLLAYATLASTFITRKYPPVWSSVAVLSGSTYKGTHDL
jgi:hypothetical protein